MKILICGDRWWKNETSIREQIVTLPKDTLIIEGGCARWDNVRLRWIGADFLAGEIAKELGYEVKEYPANWKELGDAAGPERNKQMLRDSKPDEVWAFHSDLSKSKGTRHMISIAHKAGVTVKVFAK